MNKDKGMHADGKVCNCPHHQAIPWLIILIGVDFLLGAVNIFTIGFVNFLWPILLIGIGGTKLGSRNCGCC